MTWILPLYRLQLFNFVQVTLPFSALVLLSEKINEPIILLFRIVWKIKWDNLCIIFVSIPGTLYINYNNDGDDSDCDRGEDYDFIAHIPNIQVNDKWPRIILIVHIKCSSIRSSGRFLITM